METLDGGLFLQFLVLILLGVVEQLLVVLGVSSQEMKSDFVWHWFIQLFSVFYARVTVAFSSLGLSGVNITVTISLTSSLRG